MAYALGKRAAKRDGRNFAFRELLRAEPELPLAWDFDDAVRAVPTPMFANDAHGDCVIAGRAHQTLRFEFAERGEVPRIRDADVLREWRRENGGTEDGLVVLDSLKAWRSRGWRVGEATYRIRAFAEIDRTRFDDVRRAIVLRIGAGIGLMLPDAAIAQFDEGRAWDVPQQGADELAGGHYVYCSGYTPAGPVCVTWGRKQAMTWAFFGRYCDEAWAVFDARDAWRRAPAGHRDAIDVSRLEARLATVHPPRPRSGAVSAG